MEGSYYLALALRVKLPLGRKKNTILTKLNLNNKLRKKMCNVKFGSNGV